MIFREDHVTARNNATVALAKAKALEAERIAQGAKYKRKDEHTTRLVHDSNSSKPGTTRKAQL